MKKIAILMVCNDVPYPANHGGRVDVMQKLIAFSQLGIDVDILICSSNAVSDEAKKNISKYAANIYSCTRDHPFRSLLFSFMKLLPYQISSRSQLEKISICKEYTYIIYESEYVLLALNNETIKSKEKILRVHNDEEVYFSGLAKSEHSLIKKVYYYFESFMFSLIKKKYSVSFDSYWFISCNEHSRMIEKNPFKVKDLHWIPPHMPCEHTYNADKFNNTDELTILFVGNLFTPNNVDGVIWYLENVHTTLISKNKKLSLIIAGNARGNIPVTLMSAISKFNNEDKISIIEGPTDEELFKIYKKSHIFINPMLAGAGVKLKTIDAMRNSLAIVSTTIGIEGTGLINGKHVLVADTSDAFSQAILNLYEDKKLLLEIARSSYDFVDEKFNMKEKIDELIGCKKHE